METCIQITQTCFAINFYTKFHTQEFYSRMGRKKKPFIDKKNSTTYKLVHRSQHDPLVADQDASQMVLSEIPGMCPL